MKIIIPALALMLPCFAAAASDFAQPTAQMPLAIHPTAAGTFVFKNVTVGDAKSDVVRKAGDPGLRGHPGDDQEVWYYIEDNLRVAVTFDRDVVTSVATTIF
ncbi:hypothetical protein ACYX7E_14795 [Luteimonas sp. RIT-PG2_3]